MKAESFHKILDGVKAVKHVPPPQYIGFKEGVVWNLTMDEGTVQWWLESGQIECYARFEAAEPLVFE